MKLFCICVHFFLLVVSMSPGNPKALTSQCRLAIRRYLKKIKKIHCIDQLEMPTSLINFLQYKSVPVTVL